MLTPVPATLPNSTLAPSDVLAKFSSQSLAGLGGGFSGFGCDCSTFDDSGNCLDPAPCDTSSTTSLNYPYGSSSGAGNNLTLPGAPVVSTSPAGTTTVASPSSSLTAAQQAALLSSLVSGGVNLAELGLVQPGTTLTAGGITRQTAGATTQGTPLTGAVATSDSGVLIIGLLAVAGLALMMMGQRGR